MNKKIELPEGYKPTDAEEYMNPYQLEYFRNKLNNWKSELLNEGLDTIQHLKEENWQEPDLNDRAAIELSASFELKTRDRYRKLIDKIDQALEKIEKQEYGFCEVTGDMIGLNRLEARPIASLSIEAQEMHENYERQHSDDD